MQSHDCDKGLQEFAFGGWLLKQPLGRTGGAGKWVVPSCRGIPIRRDVQIPTQPEVFCINDVPANAAAT